MKQLIQCVPNYSEGRDLAKFDKIVDVFRAKKGIKLLDYSSDAVHNRSVISLLAEPEPLEEALIASVSLAKELIDMRKHKGQHPRMGAVDVIPFVPIKNSSMAECVALSKRVAEKIHRQCGVPIYLYEKSASTNNRENLADIRREEFEGMFAKVKLPEWKLDYGMECHPTYGVTAIGARLPLIAFNVFLATDDLTIAKKIARNIRHSNGGLRYLKAIGIEFKKRGIVQVSMNLTDYTKTPLYRVVELIKIEARRYGVNVIHSELIGLAPMAAFIDTAEWYLQLENFSAEQILESHLL